MKLLFFCPLWGMTHLPLRESLEKIKSAGYDGVEFGCMPDDEVREEFLRITGDLQLAVIAQQWAATGTSFESYVEDFAVNLRFLAGFNPVLINSQTGKDYYTREQNDRLILFAQSIADELGVTIIHETHRGKFPYSAAVTLEFVQSHPSLQLTADFSHFCTVSESFLEDQEQTIRFIIPSVRHVHARVGHPQGPQVTDPRLPEWADALSHHLAWWDAIVAHHRSIGSASLTFTAEFGPHPYMPAVPFTGQPQANQWEINLHMTQLLRARYNQ